MTLLMRSFQLLVAVVSAGALACASRQGPTGGAPPTGWEGFYAVSQLNEDFFQRKGIPMKGPGVPSPVDRVGKFVLAVGPRSVPPDEKQRLQTFYCADAGTRAWNGALCDALDRASCDAAQCIYDHHGNCSGFFAGAGRFVTAAHCLADMVDLPERLAASHVLARQADGTPRRLPVTPWGMGKREFAQHWVSQNETPVDVAVLMVDDGGLPEHPRSRVEAGDVLHMVGFPRSELRSERARTQHGYALVAGTMAVSFGRVDNPNRDNAPFCSTDGKQEHWTLQQPCPFGQMMVDGEQAWKGVLLTRVFTSTMDSTNGFSGAPVFNARGEWVGVNSTIISSENPQVAYPPGFRAVATHAKDGLKALDAGAHGSSSDASP